MFLIISEIYLFLFRTHVKVASGASAYNLSALATIGYKF